MPDITMCLNDNCPIRFSCYRFLAEPSLNRQSYSKFEPKKEVEGKPTECDFHYPIKSTQP